MGSKTIAEWCASHHFSRSFFYLLDKQGKAPRTMQIGAARRISDEADRAWVIEREAESSATSQPQKQDAGAPHG